VVAAIVVIVAGMATIVVAQATSFVVVQAIA